MSAATGGQARGGAWTVALLLALVVVPAAWTLTTVREPRPRAPIAVTDVGPGAEDLAHATLAPGAPNPSPRGYTASLVMFVVPAAVLLGWLHARRDLALQRRAFWVVAGITVPGWCLLDVLLGRTFFTFVNERAVIGWLAPGWRPGHGWAPRIPVEEFVFYGAGVATILLTYAWASESWLSAYAATPERRARHDEPVRLDLRAAAIAVLGLGAAWAWALRDGPGGPVPGYLTFLVSACLVPAVLLHRLAAPFVNWRALSLTLVLVLLVSLFWEGVLGVPYQWWGYRPEQMLGPSVGVFAGLPVEAVVLWLGVTWVDVVLYESVATLLHLDRTAARRVLAGARP